MFTTQEKATKPEQPKEEDSGDEQDEDLEKEVVGNWKLVDLPVMPAVTGEEQEEQIVKFRSKIYRFKKDQQKGEWKERGVGELRFLRHKTSNYIRILVRADKTHKVIVNHYVITKDIFCKLQVLKTSNNAWTWAAHDISDEQPSTQKFAAKFTSKEDAENFRVQFDKANEHNTLIFAEQKVQETKQEEKKEEDKKE